MPDESRSTRTADDASSPRAFATTTGFVCQIVGLVYFLSASGYWFISGRVQAVSPVHVESLADYFDDANLALALTTMNVLVAVAGGLGLIAFGVGLQGQRRGSGTGAMITAGLLGLTGAVSAVLYVALASAWIRGGVVLLYALINVVLFLLAGHSAALLRAHPPPDDLNVVDDAWLEAHRRSRRGM